ncbi:hypothetical protein [Geotalea toluenoxydans]|uniref:hypothetical protein n=1 Tax=Geotalea toluenoxydans TaxID=421624 RepID=UPI000AD24BDF|nr:hypothetical protein [Geotalea toluenoxydans]
MPVLLFAFLLSIVAAVPSLATELVVGKFSAEDLGEWTEKSFRGKTEYSLTKDEGKSVLMAHSVKAGSAGKEGFHRCKKISCFTLVVESRPHLEEGRYQKEKRG